MARTAGKESNIPASHLTIFAEYIARAECELDPQTFSMPHSAISFGDAKFSAWWSEVGLPKGLLILGVRPYWKRLWVVQEVLLSKKLSVHFDDEVVDWTGLYNTLMQYQRFLENNSIGTRRHPSDHGRILDSMVKLLRLKWQSRTEYPGNSDRWSWPDIIAACL